METSQSLAIESFSYSWLTNRKFSLDSLSESLIPSLDASDEAVSEEAKYKILSSKRSLEESHNFNFDIPISKSLSLVHADEIFYQGHILPRYSDDQSKKDDFNALNSNSVLSIPISSRNVCAADRIHCRVLKKWRKTSKRIVQKCLGFFRPLCLKVGFSRRSIRVDDIDMNVWEEEVKASSPRSTATSVGNWGLRKAKSWSNSTMESAGPSPFYSAGDWSVDSSIDEAILHCKRSFATNSVLIPVHQV
ncbi:hypothetical protein TEA_008428 [Camellia sinensis var. sinensis]|uniref:Membrane-associated kinase regulator 6 n=1 Tax=Camellia sinensis var. sinensis TaxID=542762 RepID=A0A4S4EY02_CAMSN|nr:hypothetical protein TEA_008428 [Camellia sinensis var. sinensis]